MLQILPYLSLIVTKTLKVLSISERPDRHLADWWARWLLSATKVVVAAYRGGCCSRPSTMDMFHEIFLQSCEHIPNVSAQDKNGRTPLHEAARVNNTDMVEWLLSHEARMEEKTFTEQQTPLHYAARLESIEVMEILLNKGGKISCNMKTNNIIFYPT